MTKKIILAFLAVLVLVAIGLAVYVSTIDWNSRKQELSEGFSKVIGQGVEFSGNLNVSLFPQPHISANGINIINPENNEKLATIQKMETAISLRSLIKGIPDVRTMNLYGTEIWYTVDQNGKSNWARQTARKMLDIDTENRLQSFHLQNSLVHYRNEQINYIFDLSQFNADIQADGVTGPYRLDGNFMKNNELFGIAVNIGDLSQGDDVDLDCGLTHPKSESHLRYEGVYNSSQGTFSGSLSGDANKTADFINILLGKNFVDAKYNQPLMFSLDASLAANVMKLANATVKYSQYIDGSGNVIIPITNVDKLENAGKPVIDIDYKAVSLDLRPLINLLKEKIVLFKGTDEKFELKNKYDLTYSIYADKAIINDEPLGYVENMSAKGSLHDNSVSIDEFSAEAQGNFKFSAIGSLIEDNSKPNYYAKVQIEGKSLSTLASVWGYKLDAPSQSAYRDLKLDFNIAGTSAETEIGALNLIIDKTNITGKGKVIYENIDKYDIQIKADKLNVDNYVDDNNQDGSFVETVKNDLNKISALKNKDITLNLDVDNLMLRKVPYNNLSAKLQIVDNALKINELKIANLMNSNVAMNGYIKNIDGNDVSIDSLKFQIFTSESISPLLNKFNVKLPDWKIIRAQPLDINGELSGNFQKADIKLQVISNKDTNFDYNGKISQGEHFEFAGKVELKTTNLGLLVNSLGGSWKNLGSNSVINCDGNISGNSLNWQFSEAKCFLGNASYEGEVKYKAEAEIKDIKAKIKSSDLDIGNFLSFNLSKGVASSDNLFEDNFISRPDFGDAVINYDVYRRLSLDMELSAPRAFYKNKVFEDFAVSVINDQSVMKLQNLQFDHNGAKYTGDIEINYLQDPVMTGKLHVDDLLFSGIGGKVYQLNSGKMTADVDFNSSAMSFSTIINNASGLIDFNISDLSVKGIDVQNIVADIEQREYSKGIFQVIRDNLERGETLFDSTSGKIVMNDGVWEFEDMLMENSYAQINMNGKDNLKDWKMNNEFTVLLKSKSEIPAFSFTLSGLINNPTLDINVENLANKYDAYWEKIAQEEQNKKAEADRLLQQKAGDVKTKIYALEKKIEQLKKQIDFYSQMAGGEAVVKAYDEEKQAIEHINSELESLLSRIQQSDVNAVEMDNFSKKYIDYQNILEQKSKTLDKYYEDDVNSQTEAVYAKFKEILPSADKLMMDYEKMLQDDFVELSKFDSAHFMVNDTELPKYKQKIKSEYDKLQEQNNKIETLYGKTVSASPISVKVNLLQELKREISVMEREYSNMENIQGDVAQKLLRLIEERKKVFIANREQTGEDNSPIISEEKENILAKQSAEISKINEKAIRQNEERQENVKPKIFEADDRNANEYSGKQTEPVNEASSGVSGVITVPGQVEKPKETEIKENKRILRPSEGVIKEASGSITVK